jgi:hypothetical protein
MVLLLFWCPFLSKPLRADQLGLATGLQHLIDRARRLTLINQLVAGYLPAPLAQHLRVANFRAGVLVLQADSSAWRMRAHYLAPELATTLRSLPELAGLVSVQVRVAPPTATVQPPPHLPPPIISGEAGRCLADAAESVSDPRLRAALRRLAAHRRD